jgi:hypothetical protein
MKFFLFLLSGFIVAHFSWARETDASLKAQGFTEVHVGQNLYRRYTGPISMNGPEYGFLNQPNSDLREEIRDFDHVVFDQTYHIDEFGRRLTGKPISSKHFIALFGCSFTFGVGLKDEQTLSADLAKDLKTQTYNYGIPGGALNQALYRFKTENIRKQIPQKNGIFIYLPIESHISRVTGSYPSVVWMKTTPYYVRKNGHMEYDGTIGSAHPYLSWFYEKVGKILDDGSGSRQFPKYFQSDYNYFCDLTEDFGKEVIKQFPGSKFIVVNHPIASIPKEAVACLEKRNIQVVNLPFEKGELPRLADNHPAAGANEKIANALKPILEPILQALQ